MRLSLRQLPSIMLKVWGKLECYYLSYKISDCRVPHLSRGLLADGRDAEPRRRAILVASRSKVENLFLNPTITRPAGDGDPYEWTALPLLITSDHQ